MPEPMRFDILTLFPGMFESVLGHSILKRAARTVPDPAAPDDPSRARPPVATYHLTDIRQFTDNKHGKIDQPPYGGGPGMVMQCQPVWDAVQAVEQQQPERPATRVVLTPAGKPLTQPLAEQLAAQPRLLLLCGHYEGLDQRVLDALTERDENGRGGLMPISLGDYVLSGGEVPAMVLIDAVVRLLPGALGDDDSARQDSFTAESGRLLDHPHYTRPPQWRGRDVPAVLMGGDHAAIARWRREQAGQLTRAMRPDLLGQPAEDEPNRGATPKPRTPPTIVRPFRKTDADAVDALLTASLGEPEAKLARKLRRDGAALVELLAEQAGQLVAYGLASPVELVPSGRDYTDAAFRGAGLGPIAVAESRRGFGLGTALTQELLATLAEYGLDWAVVLGDPGFYGRLGFKPASNLGWDSVYQAGDAFQAMPLSGHTSPSAMPPPDPGRIRYHRRFAELDG